jgi:hypothetical protein
MKEGRFKANPQKHGMVEFSGKDGPFYKMAIEFKFAEGPNKDQLITWFGGFKGKGEDYSLKAMMACGYDENVEDWDAPWKYQQVWITIEQEEYTDGDGNEKKRMTVKYINALDDEGSQPGALIDKNRPKSEGGAKNFREGIMASHRAKRAAAGQDGSNGGGTVQNSAGPADGGKDESDIPF